MHTVNRITELRHAIEDARAQGKSIAFVPTMGNLHAGHLSLIDRAHQEADFAVCSIFVNPMQFGASEDLDAYPRTLAEDSAQLETRGCNLLFTPGVQDVYPNGLAAETRVEVPLLGQYHCGASRPGHFVGVATVVCKLFNIVLPDVAIFGEKDFQQLAVLRKMTADLCLPIRIVGVATSREDDGLARSSRNGYLSQEQRSLAPMIYQQLQFCRRALEHGERDLEVLRRQAGQILEKAGFVMDYLNFANPRTLAPLSAAEPEMVILIAARLGTTRLIDNMSVRLSQEA
jgi:pantoate--beta-alanine ligase